MKKVVVDICLFAVVFALAWLSPMLADDYGNLLQYYAHGDLPIGTYPTWSSFFSVPDMFGNLFELAYIHWGHETGRYTTAFFVRFFAGMPRFVFFAVTAGLWTIFVDRLWRLSGLSLKWHFFVAAAACAILLDFETVFWLTGAANYLWPLSVMMLVAPFFAWPRLGESVFCLRNMWMVLLSPVGLLLAGLHELLGITICLVLAVYWIREISAGRFRIDGRLLFTLGYGIGSLLVVFAPASLSRAGGAGFLVPDSQFMFTLARKGMSFLRLVIQNPFALVAVPAGIVLLCRESTRRRLGEARIWFILSALIMTAVTVFLTNGEGRTSWDASVMLFGVALIAVSLVEDKIGKRVTAALNVVAPALATAVIVTTVFQTASKNRQIEGLTDKWLAFDDELLVYAPNRSLGALSWFDRSYDMTRRFNLGAGYDVENGLIARFYGKSRPLTLMADDLLLLNSRAIVAPLNELPNVNGWFAVRESDILVHPLDDTETSMFEHGQRVEYRADYNVSPVRVPVLDRIRKRITRDGFAMFSARSPEDEMSARQNLVGFVVKNATLQCIVLFHNHNIPRDRLISLEFDR